MFCDVRWSRSNKPPTPAPRLCVSRSYCDQHAPSSHKENTNGECCSEHSASRCCLTDSRLSFSRQMTPTQPGRPRTAVTPTPTQASARSLLGYIDHSLPLKGKWSNQWFFFFFFFNPLILILFFLTETPEIYWQVSVKIWLNLANSAQFMRLRFRCWYVPVLVRSRCAGLVLLPDAVAQQSDSAQSRSGLLSK